MKLPVIIGFGNPLRRDDGMGWKAAEILDEKIAPGTAEIIGCHQLTPELAAKLKGAPIAIFLDAALNEIPGLVQYQQLDPQEHCGGSHDLSPGQLLALATQVNGSAPVAFLITGGVLESHLGEGLTPLAEACAAQMADVAGWLLAKWNPARANAVA